MDQLKDAGLGAGLVGAPVELEDSTYRKVTLRIIPFLFLCYLAAYLDRVNVGFAKLQMMQELNFSDTIYGFGAGIFFLGYVLFEVPSNVILHRVGARLWIARIMLTWGIISGITAFVQTPMTFYLMRFLLGVAEAGFIPGILLYLTYWYPAHRRGRITAYFLAAIPMSSIFGGPLSGWILHAVSGTYGLSGWRWLFLIETIPSLLLGIATLLYLDDRVASARWLSAGERQIIIDAVSREDQGKEGASEFAHAMRSPQVWLLGLIYFAVAGGIYIVSFWLPSIIKHTGVADPLSIGLLTAIPYTAAVILMILVSISADRRRERRWHTVLPCLLTVAGLVLTASSNDTVLAMIGLTMAAAGASAAQAAFWCLPATFLAGAAAAAGIALVNALGNIAGFVTTFMVGWMNDLTHSTAASLYFFAALLVIGAALILTIPARLVNK